VIAKSGVLFLALLSCLALGAQANPVVDRDERGCRDLVAPLETSSDPALQDRFVRCLGLYGFASFDSAARAHMASHLARFEPLILRAQEPPHVPDQNLLRWYLPLASREGRKSMAASLRAWLGEEALLLNPETRWAWDGALARRIAASTLADLDDQSAIPLLRSLLEPSRVAAWVRYGTGTSDPYRLQLEHALARLEKRPWPGGLTLQDGRVHWGERAQDLESVVIWRHARPQAPLFGRVEDVEPSWKLLEQARGSILAGPRPSENKIDLRFLDGMTIRLVPLGADSVLVSDEGVPSLGALYDDFLDRFKLGPPRVVLVRDAAIHDAATTLAFSGNDRGDTRSIFAPSPPERALLERVARGHDETDERLLIAILDARGFATLDAPALAVIEHHFEQFRPVLLRAQHFPLTPDRPLLEWVRQHGSSEDRRAVTESLLEFLAPRESAASPLGGFFALHDQLPVRRVMAAEILSDWGESGALPGIDRLLSSSEIKDRERMPLHLWLEQSALRLRNPMRAGLLVPAGEEVDLHRPFADVDTIYRVRNIGFERDGAVPLSSQESHRVWNLMRATRNPRPTQTHQGKWTAIFIRLKDGLEAKLSLSATGEVLYEDNARMSDGALSLWAIPTWKKIETQPIRLEQAELASYLEGLQTPDPR